jgi:DNA-binding Lrp family transcriptional regulator
MVYEKKYTVEDLLKYLRASKKEGRERTLKEIYEALDCSERTAWEILKPLLDNKIERRNVGTDKKPVWLYSLKGSSSAAAS